MSEELTYGQRVAWDIAQQGIKDMREFSNSLDKKVSGVFSASAAIVAIFAGANVFPSAGQKPGFIVGFLIAVICLLLCRMLWHASTIWGPCKDKTYDIRNADLLYRELIAREPADTYNVAMLAMAEIFSVCDKQNQYKSEVLENMVFLFMCQLVLLAVTVVVRLTW